MPVFSGHTGVTNVELLIYIFFCGGRVQFQLYTGKHTLYGHGTKCAKRTEAGPKAQLRARL